MGSFEEISWLCLVCKKVTTMQCWKNNRHVKRVNRRMLTKTPGLLRVLGCWFTSQHERPKTYKEVKTQVFDVLGGWQQYSCLLGAGTRGTSLLSVPCYWRSAEIKRLREALIRGQAASQLSYEPGPPTSLPLAAERHLRNCIRPL